MKLFKINNAAIFMTGLLSEKETVFDSFLLSEAIISTSNAYTIDGHINKDFYTADELDLLREKAKESGRIFSENLIRWESVKGYCYSYIRGKKPPLSFRITLALAQENVIKFLNSVDSPVLPEQISSLNVNIKYDGGALTCTTAVSLNIFSIDRTLNEAWDNMFERFLDSHGYDHDTL
ncbi:MAG: DUF5721 family protein [Lachnospiraceae bacterium]|nr:DUF5721 family protein [Lachnospiraceae bacterium]